MDKQMVVKEDAKKVSVEYYRSLRSSLNNAIPGISEKSPLMKAKSSNPLTLFTDLNKSLHKSPLRSS
jgi:hypothetical protein